MIFNPHFLKKTAKLCRNEAWQLIEDLLTGTLSWGSSRTSSGKEPL